MKTIYGCLTTMLVYSTLQISFAQTSLATATPGVKLFNGRLAFTSMETFRSTYTSLQTADSRYVETRPAPADGVFQDEDPVLEKFEQQFVFQSLRRLNLESEFKQLEAGIDPFLLKKLTPIRDKFVNAFLNKDKVLQIGDTIYFHKTNDFIVKIGRADEKALAAILAGKNPFDFPNVKILSSARKKTADGVLCEIDFSFSGNLMSSTVTFSILGAPVSGTTYQWNFGDNTPTVTQPNPVHTYATAGTYTVSLSINRGDTCFATKTYTVPVNQSCIAFFSKQEIPNQPGGISFHDLSTSSAAITSWAWNFGDGGTSTLQHPTHTYTCDGSFQATLTITSSTGCTRSFSKNVNVVSLRCCDHDIDVRDTKFTYVTPDGQHKLEGNCEDWQPVLMPWVRKMNAELHHWKKKSNGNWKKDKAPMKIDLAGNVYVKDATSCTCKNPVSIAATLSGNAKKVELNKAVNQDFKTWQNDVWKAFFYHNNVLIKTLDNTNILLQCD